MALWDVSNLIGGRALIPVTDGNGNYSEVWGTITEVVDVFRSEDETLATNLSEFSLKTDAGEVIKARGHSFAQLVAEPRLPPA
jgi:hypothetical protein